MNSLAVMKIRIKFKGFLLRNVALTESKRRSSNLFRCMRNFISLYFITLSFYILFIFIWPNQYYTV